MREGFELSDVMALSCPAALTPVLRFSSRPKALSSLALTPTPITTFAPRPWPCRSPDQTVIA